MPSLHYQPIAGKAEEIIDAILQTPEVASCSGELFAIHLVCEELVVNVVSYAYSPTEEGYLHIDIDKTDGVLTIRFTDGGVAFDPLGKEDPDLNLPPEERPIGGLGIFLTKQMMDEVDYHRVAGENVLTIKKKIAQV
ncbi:MAG: ATP-binding protein [Alloprevotella sp.]